MNFLFFNKGGQEGFFLAYNRYYQSTLAINNEWSPRCWLTIMKKPNLAVWANIAIDHHKLRNFVQVLTPCFVFRGERKSYRN